MSPYAYYVDVTQLVAELLCATYSTLPQVYASTSVTLHASATGYLIRKIPVSGVGSLSVHAASTAGRARELAGDSSLLVASTCDAGRERDLGAGGGFFIGSATAGLDARTYTAASESGFTAHSASTGYVATIRRVTASNALIVAAYSTEHLHIPTSFSVYSSGGFRIRSKSYEPRPFTARAASHLYLYGVTGSHNTSIEVTGLGLFSVSANGDGLSVGSRPVAASTRVNLAPSSVGHSLGSRPVESSSSIVLRCGSSEKEVGPRLVGAAGSFSLHSAATQKKIGPKYVAASSGVKLKPADYLSTLKVHGVFCQSYVSLASVAKEKGVFAAAGTGAFAGRGSATTKYARSLSVSATTAFAVADSPRTQEFWRLSGADRFTLFSTADKLITGTLSDGGVVLFGMSFASVWIPWRRTGLSRPAGGNLPHS